jgi:hypothetical protein
VGRVVIFVLALAAGALAVVGALGTWVSGSLVVTVSYKGTDANAGKTVLAASIAAVVLLALATWGQWRWLAVLAAIPAAIAGAIAGYYFASPAKFANVPDVSRGWGLYLAAIGGIVLFVLCLLHALLPKLRPAPASAPPPPA